METNVIKPDISIIVPVYNVEKHLIRCLDSIFAETISGRYQVIAVDDCSTDKSLEILREYQKKENRLIIIEHTENRKLSSARSTGIQAATGDYIMHVDSDDRIIPGSLENLLLATRDRSDVIVFNHLRESNSGKQEAAGLIQKNQRVVDKNTVRDLFLGSCWNKLVRRDILQQSIYAKVGLNSLEDLIYSMEVFFRSTSIYLIADYCYIYYHNTDSITAALHPEHYLNTQFEVLGQIELLIETYKPGQEFENYIRDYFEKWIYLAQAKIHFWNKNGLHEVEIMLENFRQFCEMPEKRFLRLELAGRNKWISLREVRQRFGNKMPVSIVVKGMFKK